MTTKWKTAKHNGMWLSREPGALKHSADLEKLLRVVYRDEPSYVEFAVGAGDAPRIKALLAFADEMAEALISRDVDYGYHTDCLACGMRTYHEKDGEVAHEENCVIVRYAAALLADSGGSR